MSLAVLEQSLCNGVAFQYEQPRLNWLTKKVQEECLQLEASKSQLSVVHVFTLQLGPVCIAKLERSASLVSLRTSRVRQYSGEFPAGVKMISVDMLVLTTNPKDAVLIEETSHMQWRKTIKNAHFASSSPTSAHSKET